jgi:hypothetical protein
MTPKKILEKIASDYSKKLAAMPGKLQSLEGLAFPVEFDVSKTQKIPDIDAANVVYVITSAAIPKNIESLYRKGRNSGWAIAQYNDYRKPGFFLDDNCVYVGSCSKSGIVTRLRQHLGLLNGKGTSSLHLKHWWEKAKVKIYLFKFEDTLNNDDPDALQTIEDTVWDVCKPLFGKKGPRARKFKNEEEAAWHSA